MRAGPKRAGKRMTFAFAKKTGEVKKKSIFLPLSYTFFLLPSSYPKWSHGCIGGRWEYDSDTVRNKLK